MNYKLGDGVGVLVEIIALDLKILIALDQDTENVPKIRVCWNSLKFLLMIEELRANAQVFTMMAIFLRFSFLIQESRVFNCVNYYI